jgi:hypothetical protein
MYTMRDATKCGHVNKEYGDVDPIVEGCKLSDDREEESDLRELIGYRTKRCGQYAAIRGQLL